MHIVWFVLMVSSFMALVGNNVRVIVYRSEYEHKSAPYYVGMFVGHVLTYILFYFALREFIEYLVLKY